MTNPKIFRAFFLVALLLAPVAKAVEFNPAQIPTIEKTKLAADVQASLDLADSALQSFTEVDGSVTNEIQDLTLTTNTLALSGDATTVDLSTYLDNATHTGDVTGSGALTIAAGAVDLSMLSATGTADANTYLRGDNTWAVLLIDEDTLVSDSATQAPTQQSVKAYVDGYERMYSYWIWAEEGAALSTGTSSGWQWSFGNGATGQFAGINVYEETGEDCKFTRMSTRAISSSTYTVDLGIDAVAQGATAQVSVSASANGTVALTPLDLASGATLVSFKTSAVTTGTNSPHTVGVKITCYY